MSATSTEADVAAVPAPKFRRYGSLIWAISDKVLREHWNKLFDFRISLTPTQKHATDVTILDSWVTSIGIRQWVEDGYGTHDTRRDIGLFVAFNLGVSGQEVFRILTLITPEEDKTIDWDAATKAYLEVRDAFLAEFEEYLYRTI
jgi:hypothetical protein